MKTAALIFCIVLWCGVVWYLAYCVLKTRAELDQTIDQLHAERKRRHKTEDDARDLVVKVTPLIAQTDWMTGRWGGQFQTLVQMENKRNAQVVAARKAIWSIPLVKDHIDNTLIAKDPK